MNQTKEQTYYVKGMHCASCEIIIEKKILEIKGVKSVDASTTKSEVLVEYEDKKPNIEHLNNILKRENYHFSEKPFETKDKSIKNNLLTVGVISVLIIFVFFLLNRLGVSGALNVNAKSSLPTFFIFGLLAGISTCAALVGGLVLSMSKQWSDLYAKEDSFIKKFQPHLLFNTGRLISYGILGGLLGAIGSKLHLSLTFSSILVLAVAVLMIFLGLQMLGLKVFQKFQLTTPKFITRYIADETHFKGRYLPFVLGAATFFLPCGFTITAQGMALLSSSALTGSLIMLFFALGTLPMLILIGFSSTQFLKRPHLSSIFLKVGGILVLFFALYNVNAQFNVLGLPSFNNITLKSVSAVKTQTTDVDNIEGLSPIINGKQVIKMDASASGYTPNYFKVKANTPVRWEITDKGTSGCTNAVIARDFFSGQIDLTHGQISVKEFTPDKPGKYKFSCWMGMVTGVIEVVDKNSASKSASNSNVNTSANSQNKNNSSCSANGGGCGCGCGGSGCH